ncbi:hypothetical protein [Glycomyces dulcitolivorans]|uniref:hypothetical protein n=1 Tax=Glycomyces dulcitolivorans TaxID=2200759 RepID=UPI0013003770|nr:hypothetical protein [Glycomyces dulcitolivorans]
MSNSMRISVTVNLGPGAPIGTISALLDDLNAICQIGGQLEERAVRAEALKAVLRDPGLWGKEELALSDILHKDSVVPWVYAEDLVSPVIEQGIASYIRDQQLAHVGDVYVERIAYANPLEVFLLGGALLLALLKGLEHVRDWTAQRSIGRSQASDYEHQVQVQKQLRDYMLDQVISGKFPLKPEQIDDFARGVTDPFRRLGQTEVEVQKIEGTARRK